ncbi:response regulator [Thermomonas sp.]|uniref:response regulator n=1 Tax=Thermomonas sp. TaxID=1971895 RepID=UPI00260EFA97|nr:response regulator [Thermomonas sp.]
MYRLLLVDDEPNILNAQRRCLSGIPASRLGGEALRIETFTSPRAALDRCEETEFDLIITDYRMPEMNGVEFLTSLVATQPDVPRMIVSGLADRDAIIAAVNQGRLTRFMEKPWSDEALQDAVATILVGRGSHGSESFGQRAATELERRHLEEESPGITHVERESDGSIHLDLDDFDS